MATAEKTRVADVESLFRQVEAWINEKIRCAEARVGVRAATSFGATPISVPAWKMSMV